MLFDPQLVHRGVFRLFAAKLPVNSKRQQRTSSPLGRARRGGVFQLLERRSDRQRIGVQGGSEVGSPAGGKVAARALEPLLGYLCHATVRIGLCWPSLSSCGDELARVVHSTIMKPNQDHWRERGRATLYGNLGALGRPHHSVRR